MDSILGNTGETTQPARRIGEGGGGDDAGKGKVGEGRKVQISRRLPPLCKHGRYYQGLR